MASKVLSQSTRVVRYFPNMFAIVSNVKTSTHIVRNVAALSSSVSDKNVTVNHIEKGSHIPLSDVFAPKDPRFPLPGNTGIDASQFLSDDDSQPVTSLVETLLENTECERTRKHKVLDQYVGDIQMQESFEQEVTKLVERLYMSKVIKEIVPESVGEPSKTDQVEWSVQQCPSFLHRGFMELFPDISINSGDLTMVNVCQKTKHDMSGWSPEVGEERDQLNVIFMDCATEICNSLKEQGYWADFIDPASGTPYFGAHTNTTLFETDERYNHFGFNITDLGCCKVISHKLWGTHVFVGSIFTNAPVDSAIQIETKYNLDHA